VHLFLTAAVVLTLGEPAFMVWALALLGLTAAVYLRAVLAVGLSWRRIGFLIAAPLVVGRLAGLVLDGLVRRRTGGWEDDPPQDPPAGDAPAGPTTAARPRFARRPAPAMRFLHGPFVTSRHDRSSVVSLTFDDGPHPLRTPAVLDRLRRYRTRATFYLIGERVAAAPTLPERIVGDGHALGNHTFSHPSFAPFAAAEPLRELTRCQAAVPLATTFRPPYGRLTPGVLLAARRLGLPVVTWSIDSGDWLCRCEADAVACAHQILELVRPGDIVLLHDDRPWVGTILDVLLPELLARGLLDAPIDAVPTAGRRGRNYARGGARARSGGVGAHAR
jgi:peptidoglycan/xylan/chitin deacetylase (PgdA/CDA1 family)